MEACGCLRCLIFSVGRVRFFGHDMKPDDVNIKKLVAGVEKECSFAEALGAKPGQGEGIVLQATEYRSDAEF